MFACIFYSVFAIISPLVNVSGTVMFVLCLLIEYITTLVAYSTEKLKKQLFVFVMFTLIMMVYVGTNFVILKFVLRSNSMPFGVSIISLFVVTYLLKQCEKALNSRKNIKNFTYDVEILDNNKKIKTKAFLDSGNILKDKNENIVVCNYNFFCKLYKHFSFSNFLSNKTDGLKDGRIIEIKTVAGKSKCIAFKVDKLIVENKNFDNVTIAVSKAKICGFGCDVILNSNMFGGNNV